MDSQTLALVLSTLAQLRGARQRHSTARAIATEAACIVIVAMASMAAIGCAAVALWSGVLPLIGPVWAPLVAAGAFVVVAALALLVMSSVRSRKHEPEFDPAH